MSRIDPDDQRPPAAERLPPRQVATRTFPVMSMAPTPVRDLSAWHLTLKHGVRLIWRGDHTRLAQLPRRRMTCDIHCVTRWSRLDTRWEGVMLDDLLVAAGVASPPTAHLLAHGADGYATNLACADLLGGRAMIATHVDGAPLTPEHGGPARLLVPHLYFWKSAKWLTGLQFTAREELGYWELRGYHRRGDPWREERFAE